MIFYDMATKVVDTESFPQQNIAGDISGITFVLFSQKPLQWKEINTHTHTSNKYEWITVRSGHSAKTCDCCDNTKFVKTKLFYSLFFRKIVTFSNF